MYNGIEAAQIKGTGLSGYVERSKATVNSRIAKFIPAGVDEERLQTEAINPLVAKRSQKENNDMANRLKVHQAIRAVKLKVLLYKEERLAQGIMDTDLIERECEELYNSLMQVVVAEQREKKKADDAKTASRFAAAFGIKQPNGPSGQAFDRARQEEAKRLAEEERRKLMEYQLIERLKRARPETQADEENERTDGGV